MSQQLRWLLARSWVTVRTVRRSCNYSAGERGKGQHMKTAKVRTVCECQAFLLAELDEQLNVVSGTCEDSRGRITHAPSSKAFVSKGQMGITFACPVCSRNALRTFSLAKFVWVESQAPKRPQSGDAPTSPA